MRISFSLQPGSRHSSTLVATTVAISTLLSIHVATAAVTSTTGYIHDALNLGTTTQSCVASSPTGAFVGVGPGFTANAQSIVHVSEAGVVRTVATGFSSISDCAYDAASDTLYVGDNADSGDIPGASTGDTIFRIPSASSAADLTAVGLELLPQNSFPAIAGITIDASGNLFVASANGSGAGTVQKIVVSGPTTSSFASGFDYASGVAIEPSTFDLLVAESTDSFETKISRYDSNGTFVSTLAGPSFSFGSYDETFTLDGKLLATGSSTIAAFTSDGTQSTFAAGFSFATGISENSFTGRVEALDSFSFDDSETSIHRFTPVSALVPGGTKARVECLQEFYGVKLAAARPGGKERDAICVDGAACDADGKINDECAFPIGFCFNVSDSRTSDCSVGTISEVSLKTSPELGSADTVATRIHDALPLTTSSCFFSNGITVPVRVTASGKKAGRGLAKVKTRGDSGKDNDSVRLICQPAA